MHYTFLPIGAFVEQPPSSPPVPPGPPPPPAEDALQFDKVEYAGAGQEPTTGSAACAACKAMISDSYYEVNGQVMCPSCKAQLQGAISGGLKSTRIIKALLFGFVAMVVSSVGYYMIRKLMDAEFAIATIAMGWAVGWAVHRGAAGRGGWFYQTAAVVLTYCAISFSYVPHIFEAFSARADEPGVIAEKQSEGGVKSTPTARDDRQTTSASDSVSTAPASDGDIDNVAVTDVTPSAAGLLGVLGITLFFVLSLPIRMGMESPILILIYAFGLWQAFQMNRRPHIVVTGPYSTRGGVASTPATEGIPTPDNKVL